MLGCKLYVLFRTQQGQGLPSAHLGTELRPGCTPPQLPVHWGVSGEVSGRLNLGALGKCPVDTGETSRRGEGQGRDGRREETSLVTVVQWLGAAWRNRAAVSANSVRQAPWPAGSANGLSPSAGPTWAVGVRSTMEGTACGPAALREVLLPSEGEAVIGPQQRLRLPEGILGNRQPSPLLPQLLQCPLPSALP